MGKRGRSGQLCGLADRQTFREWEKRRLVFQTHSRGAKRKSKLSKKSGFSFPFVLQLAHLCTIQKEKTVANATGEKGEKRGKQVFFSEIQIPSPSQSCQLGKCNISGLKSRTNNKTFSQLPISSSSSSFRVEKFFSVVEIANVQDT